MIGTLSTRPLQPDDAPEWAELLNAIEAVDRFGEVYDAEAAAEELTDPRIDLAESLLVLDGDRPVGYAVLWPVGEQLLLDAGVHPEFRRRGIGTALVEHGRTRAAARSAPLHLRLPDGHPGAAGIVRSFDLVALRYWATLERVLTDPLPRVVVPAGLALAPLGPDYDAARWDEPLRRARNASFADHWGSRPESAEHFAHGRTASAAFRPGCSAALTAANDPDGPVAGFLLAYEYQPGELYVGTVGTLPGFRARGGAGALLAYSLDRARTAGYRTSSLTVDTQNPTGAGGVYARAGYTLRRSDTTWELPATSPRVGP